MRGVRKVPKKECPACGKKTLVETDIPGTAGTHYYCESCDYYKTVVFEADGSTHVDEYIPGD